MPKWQTVFSQDGCNNISPAVLQSGLLSGNGSYFSPLESGMALGLTCNQENAAEVMLHDF